MNPEFNGDVYEPKFDKIRLTGQIHRIFELMRDGRYRTLGEISNITGDGEASISAQLRHLKKERFGGHTLNKQHRGDRKSGLWEYQLIVCIAKPEPLTDLFGDTVNKKNDEGLQ